MNVARRLLVAALAAAAPLAPTRGDAPAARRRQAPATQPAGPDAEKLPFTPDTIKQVVAYQAAEDPGLLRGDARRQGQAGRGQAQDHVRDHAEGIGEEGRRW